MRQALIMACLLLPAVADAQSASEADTALVSSIAGCLVQGAPEGWERLYMIVELAKPLDETGDVRYIAERGDQRVTYQPCDLARPPRALIDARKDQAPERRAWTGARLIIHSDGKFQLNYDYP